MAREVFQKKRLTKIILIALGIPSIFIPGLLLAATLGWDWQKDMQKLTQIGDFRKYAKIFPKEAVVIKVLDGDTIELHNGMTLRMVGIDAPNRGEEKYDEVTEYVRELIEDERVFIEYDAYQTDKFGRALGYVFENCTTHFGCQEGKRMINWLLVKKGMAKIETYEDRRPLKYKKILEEAEINRDLDNAYHK